jgi:hypothetical protein
MSIWQWIKTRILGDRPDAIAAWDYRPIQAMESRIAQLRLDREKAVKAKKKHSHYDNEIRSLRSAILKAERAGWR